MDIDEPQGDTMGRRAGKSKEVVRDASSPARASRSATAEPSRRNSTPVIPPESVLPMPVEANFPLSVSEDPIPPMIIQRPFAAMDLDLQPSPVAELNALSVTVSPLRATSFQDSIAPSSNPRLVRSPRQPLADTRPIKKQRTVVRADGEDDLMLDTGFFKDLHGMSADRLAEIARSVKKAPRVPETPRTAETPGLTATPRSVTSPRPVENPRPIETPCQTEVAPPVQAPPQLYTPSLMESAAVRSSEETRLPEEIAPSPEAVPVDIAADSETAQPPSPLSVSSSTPKQLVSNVAPRTPPPPPRYTCPEQFPAHRPPAVPAAHIIFASPKLTAFPKARDAPSAFPAEILISSVTLEADGGTLLEEDLERMAQNRVELMRKVAALQELGRTRTMQTPTSGKNAGPSRAEPRSHHDLLDDAIRFRSNLLREDKHKVIQVKRTVKAIQGYFSGSIRVLAPPHINLERKKRAIAREVAKMVRLRWKDASQVSFVHHFVDFPSYMRHPVRSSQEGGRS